MIQVGRSWDLWAHRYESGSIMNVGAKRWVELHGLTHPIIPVRVEEILGDRYAPEVTHYGWQYAESSPYRHGDTPTMIQRRCGLVSHDQRPERALMLLSMCFPYGLEAAVKHGEGSVVALRIEERADE